MKKSIQRLIVWMFALPILLASCSETDTTVDSYANWDVRNQEYIDSIAKVAKANLGDAVGQWKVIRSYKPVLPELGDEDENVNTFVYCKVLAVGTGEVSPLFKDTVAVNYRGKLIDGTVFDQNYTGEYNPSFATPVEFAVGAVITGWTTALQHMKAGDRWEMYIPYELAYGASGSGTILGYSTLYFDVDLRKILPLKGLIRSLADEEFQEVE
ncbi:MAG: FKBP-type peptidyl-prolyl cis-trans isomerase [Phocaeicola sp.]